MSKYNRVLAILPITALLLLLLKNAFTRVYASVNTAAEDEYVTTLTSDNFDSFLESNVVVLVKFYAPWCGHCKMLAPEYETAGKMLKENGSSVKLAKVDATQESTLADKYKVRGYPTLHLFRNKQQEEYSGGRTAESIYDWLVKMTGPSVSLVEETEVRRLRESPLPGSSVNFVGMFPSKDNNYSIFEKVADNNRQTGKFSAHVNSNEQQIFVIRGDEEPVFFTGSLNEPELTKFVTDESLPLFGPINGENFKSYAERSQEIVWYCGEKDDYESVKESIREAAKKYRQDYSFVWLDTEQFKGHAENALGVSDFPALVCQSKKGRFVLPNADHAKDSQKLIQFIQDVQNEKIEKSLKSEPIPEANDESVKVVVGKNFEDMVLTKDKDVLLEVYAPWCGHCKKLEPIYKELADNLKDYKHLVIAKMDGTANEAPVDSFDWTGFPTLFFVKAGEKVPMRFEGPRTLEGLTEYITKHSSQPLIAADKDKESRGKDDEL